MASKVNVRAEDSSPAMCMVKMDLSDEMLAYHLIKNTPKVTGFLGSRENKPVADFRRSEANADPAPGSRRCGTAPAHDLV